VDDLQKGDIEASQRELFEESQQFFEDWYDREEAYRQEFLDQQR